MNPMGLQKQKTVDETGKVIDKYRMTHDLSFPTQSGNSVNNTTIEELLMECFYGQCLRRIIHMIVAQRNAFRNTSIYIIKYDFDAAYRRLHVHPTFAVRAITVLSDLAYILTRLPFGSAAAPSIYSCFSEAIFELANDLLQDEEWDPEKIHSSYTSKLHKKEPLDENIPFDETVPLLVKFPLRERYCDGYIDDGILLAVDKNNNVKKCQKALPIATDVVMRPLATTENEAGDPSIQYRKLKGEGTPSERRRVLGWILCTRTLRVYLPPEKAIYWIQQINTILSMDKIKKKDLESLIGKLNHVGFILPHSRYFLNRLRHLFFLAQKFGPQPINNRVREDLKLWINFLESSAQLGTSMNLIVFAKWSIRICTDACEHGIGGWNPITKKGWRIKLPNYMLGRYHINFLEFLAAWIGVWIEMLENKQKYTRYLCLTDNSCAIGWLYKANFCPDSQKVNDVVARKMAEVLMDNECCLFSQHIKGSSNVIADALSRDHHLPDKQLTFALNAIYPKQTTKALTISPTVPNEIISFLELFKDGTINTKASLVQQTPSKLGALLAGCDSWTSVVSKINTLTRFHQKDESSSCPLLQAALDETRKGQLTEDSCEAPQSVPPFPMFARPSGRTYGGARC